MKKKKICVLSPSFEYGGGLEKVAYELGISLSNTYDIFYFSFCSAEKQFIVKGKDNHFSLNETTKFSILKYFYMLRYAKKLSEYLKKKGIKKIISNSERGNIISLFCKRLYFKDLEVITITHNYHYFNKIYFKYLIKWLYPYAKKNVCVSKTIEGDLSSIFSLDNTMTIYNSFDFKSIDKKIKEPINFKDKSFLDSLENKQVYINIGRLTKQKGQINLINSFHEIVKRDKNSVLLIFGEGELREEFENQIRRLNLQKNVYLMGFRKNIFPYLNKGDVFLFSSLWEGFGLVLVEALYSGLNVISTDCRAGPREILEPSLNISENISYPYYGKFGILVNEEFELSKVSFKFNSFTKSELIRRFDKKHTNSIWTSLIES